MGPHIPKLAGIAGLFNRIWRGIMRALLAVHYFDFWEWVERQAYPGRVIIVEDRTNRTDMVIDEMPAHGRYTRNY